MTSACWLLTNVRGNMFSAIRKTNVDVWFDDTQGQLILDMGVGLILPTGVCLKFSFIFYSGSVHFCVVDAPNAFIIMKEWWLTQWRTKRHRRCDEAHGWQKCQGRRHLNGTLWQLLECHTSKWTFLSIRDVGTQCNIYISCQVVASETQILSTLLCFQCLTSFLLAMLSQFPGKRHHKKILHWIIHIAEFYARWGLFFEHLH